MPPLVGILFGVGVLVFDGLIFLVVVLALSRGWNRFALNFPACLPRPDAVKRGFQSFRMGIFNLGWSVHVAADSEMLHLTPVALLRLGGARAASIPWSEVRLTSSKKSRGFVAATIRGVELSGPAWVMSLAE